MAQTLTADDLTALAAAVWTYATRTLTATAAATTAAVAGATLTVTQATSYAATLTGLTIPAAWTKCWLTVKRAVGDADTAALVQLLVSNPGVGTDGLQRLNGAAATAGQGSLVVTQAAGTLTIALSDTAAAALTVRDGLLYDVKVKTATGTQVLTSGTLDIAAVVTQARA